MSERPPDPAAPDVAEAVPDDAARRVSPGDPVPAPERELTSEAGSPPEHVLAAFGVAGVFGGSLGSASRRVWRYGDTVLKAAHDPAAAAWAAGVFESLRVSGIRVPRPVRALDGRWVVGGWCAERFVSGRPAARFDETLTVSTLFHASLRPTPRPRFLADRDDMVGWADRLAWGEAREGEPGVPSGSGAQLWSRIAAGRAALDLDEQLIHCDLFGRVLFAGSAPPAVIDFNPLFRPAEYAAAVLTVDAVAWGGAPTEFAESASGHPDWAQLLRRAVLFRLAMNLVHPRSTPESTARIMSAATALAPVRD